MTGGTDPYIHVDFQRGPRGFVSISHFDGVETRSAAVSLRDDNPSARITEHLNNAVRFVLNEFDRQRREAAARKRDKENNDE